MKDIKRTSSIVLDILREVPETRDNDMRLYYEVCYRKNIECLGEPFGYVIMNLKSLKLPPFESVRRSRQKLQNDYPEFRGTDKAMHERFVNECCMREFAREVV